jgi:hypothetical protein
MGLTVTRKVGETVLLEITPGTTPQELWDQLQSGLRIKVTQSSATRAQLDITAPRALTASRPEQHSSMADTELTAT